MGTRAPDSSSTPPGTRLRSHTIPPPTSTTVLPAQATLHQNPVRSNSSGRSRPYLPPDKSTTLSSSSAVAAKPNRLQRVGDTIAHPHRYHAHPGETHARLHRHTKSDIHSKSQLAKARDEPPSSAIALPHLTAGLAAERARHAEPARFGTDVWTARANAELSRMNSTRSYLLPAGADGRSGDHILQHASSDARNVPSPSKKPAPSAIEIALDRAQVRKRTLIASATPGDVSRMAGESREAETELRTRLGEMAKVSTDLTRRLDYTYYSLLEKLGNLVSTVHSFQSLSAQTKDMMDNFERETEKLGVDVRKRAGVFKQEFERRDERVKPLERRGVEAGKKAMELGQRLENARVIVQNWGRREEAAVRKRGRVWKGIWIGFLCLLGTILMLIILKEWRYDGDPAKAALRSSAVGNVSLPRLDEVVSQQSEIDPAAVEKRLPDDVKSVLSEIDARRKSTEATWTWPPLKLPTQTQQQNGGAGEGEGNDDVAVDERLRALEEL